MDLNKEEIIEKLFSNRIVDQKTDCWIWTGYLVKGGYGLLPLKINRFYVHRLSAYLWKGFDIASKLRVLHECDRPPCFNPNHLFIGTQQDNMDDMVKKGRSVKIPGSRNGNSKLTESLVIQIRMLRREGWELKQLKEHFGVSQSTINQIIYRKIWTHV